MDPHPAMEMVIRWNTIKHVDGLQWQNAILAHVKASIGAWNLTELALNIANAAPILLWSLLVQAMETKVSHIG